MRISFLFCGRKVVAGFIVFILLFVCQPTVQTTHPIENSVPADKVGPLGFAPCLAQHGYTQWTSYQPASRFWPFQWIEGGWLLALSVLLTAVTVWLVRRRVA